jgi:hypothetical protein
MNWKTKKFCGAWLAVLAVLLAAGIFLAPGRHQPARTGDPAGKIAAATNAGPVRPSASELSRRQALFASFQKHPFAVAKAGGAFDWTAEDGKSPAVIRQLAHNELEFERMAEESARIYRRQLVYVKTTPDMLIQQSKLFGEPVKQLTLPGLDGQEVSFEIAATDLSASGQAGTFSGHVAGRPDSMVTLAFKGGRMAFTVLSPSDQLYLVGEPREPGEVIVKSINPDTYVVGACGTPD